MNESNVQLGGPSDQTSTTSQLQVDQSKRKPISPDEYEADDPSPPSTNASAEEKAIYESELKKYINEMYDCLSKSSFTKKDLWIEFTI